MAESRRAHRGAGRGEVVLNGAPRLGPLYVKAALGALTSRGDELPDTTVVREDVRADPDQLAAYARLCGFALDDALPLTFPALLSFPLQVALMTDRGFPLALPGLVHVRNTITARRRIDAAEPLRLAVHAQRFVAHPKGATVDLVTSVTADAVVWECRSTYLARGARAPGPRSAERAEPATEPRSAERGEPATGPAPGRAEPPGVDGGPPTAVWRVDADTGRRYARISGDVNPIHLHPLTARAFGFRRAIAHGMWTAAHALAALQGRLPDACTYDVTFAKPLLLPSTVELRTQAAGDGWYLDVRSRSGARYLRACVIGVDNPFGAAERTRSTGERSPRR